MKVIATDNFDREIHNDKLIASNLTPEEAETMAKELNSKESEDSDWYFKAVSDGYELFVFKP